MGNALKCCNDTPDPEQKNSNKQLIASKTDKTNPKPLTLSKGKKKEEERTVDPTDDV